MDAEQKKKFGEFLSKMFHEWSGRKLPERPSQAEFAVFLGVPTTNLSTWMNGQKSIGDRYLDIIAEKLVQARLTTRSQIYAAAGVSPRMPRDKKFSVFAALWDRMPEHIQNRWYEEALNIEQEMNDREQRERA